MKYATALALLAGAASVSAVPKGRSRRGAVERSRVNMKNETYPQYSSNWAGAVQIASGFTEVTGTITVPSVNGQPGAAAAAWVGIDGDTCQSAILQTGLSFYGDGTIQGWYEWIPADSVTFNSFSASAGDQVKMSVQATSTSSGTATLENLTTGQSVSHTFTNPESTLCETNAEWIVEDFEQGGSLVPFADFGTITFTDASATGSSGTVTPSGATIMDIESNGQVLTDCSISGGDVSCTYIGSY